jgi:hypothetical protein
MLPLISFETGRKKHKLNSEQLQKAGAPASGRNSRAGLHGWSRGSAACAFPAQAVGTSRRLTAQRQAGGVGKFEVVHYRAALKEHRWERKARG